MVLIEPYCNIMFYLVLVDRIEFSLFKINCFQHRKFKMDRGDLVDFRSIESNVLLPKIFLSY